MFLFCFVLFVRSFVLLIFAPFCVFIYLSINLTYLIKIYLIGRYLCNHMCVIHSSLSHSLSHPRRPKRAMERRTEWHSWWNHVILEAKWQQFFYIVAVDIAISAQKGITTCATCAGAVARNLLGIEDLSSNSSVSLQCSCEPPVGHFSADAVLWLFCQVSKITSATVVSSQVLSLICTSAFQHLGRAHFASQISARPRQHRGIRRDVIFAIHYWHMFTLDHVYGIHTIGCIPIVPC